MKLSISDFIPLKAWCLLESLLAISVMINHSDYEKRGISDVTHYVINGSGSGSRLSS